MSKTLQFRDEKSPSTGQKAAIVGWYLVAAFAATLLVPDDSGGDQSRGLLLAACVALYIARAAHTLFSFVKRAIPWWEAAYGGGIIGAVLFFFLLTGLRDPHPLDATDLAAVLLYVAGSWIGTASEASRERWKAMPEHAGHIYTDGLFRYSRHINYFGDLLLFAGLAMLTRQPWTAFVPLGMAANFVFSIIPAHDAYLKAHYGEEFDRYASHTRKLVPLLY